MTTPVPLYAVPQDDNAQRFTFSDVDTRCKTELQVVIGDDVTALIAVGPQGGLKGIVWLSPTDALTLAHAITARYGKAGVR